MAKFVKGQSGNPAGRAKKGQTITDLLNQKLDKERFADALLGLAYSGDLAACKLVLNYVDGVPTQKVEQSGQLSIVVQYADELTLTPDDDDDDAEASTTA